jgi:hypothetical protein
MSPFDAPNGEPAEEPDENNTCPDCGEPLVDAIPRPMPGTACSLSEVMDDMALAESLNLMPSSLWEHLEAGCLRGRLVEGRWFIHRDAIRAWLQVPTGA